MTIGIISDSHDIIENIKKAIEIFNKKKVDLVIHCGDYTYSSSLDLFKKLNCELKGVLGNCDKYKNEYIKKIKNFELLDRIGKIEIDMRKIAIFHGDNESILNSLITSEEFDVVFSGHTHEYLIKNYGKTLHINPGCCCGYKRYTKIKPSIAIYDTKLHSAEIIKY